MEPNDLVELRSNVQQFVRMFGLLDQSTTPCGFSLSVSQVMAMQELERQTLTVSDLAQRLQLERSSVSRLVDGLVKGGFLHREINEQNRREVLLSLTEKGIRSIEMVREQSLRYYHAILGNLTTEQQQPILQGFRTFTQALQTYKGEPHEQT